MKGKQPVTSRLAYEKIMASGAREGMYKKIISTLEKIGEGTSWDIARYLNEKPDRVWKRNAELKQAEIIIDTGKFGLTPDNNPAIIYALFTQKEKYKDTPKPEKVMQGNTISHFSRNIDKIGKGEQASLF